MGDVVSSSKYEARKLGKDFNTTVNYVNEEFKEYIVSPLTITLGDEFQSVVNSIKDGIKTIFELEERILREQHTFKLHYVLYEGDINTKINTEIAYGMMGPGLTEARKMLNSKSRARKRFQFHLEDELQTKQITRIFEVLDSIILGWKRTDFSLILSMINNENNQQVGDQFGKTRSQIWKRRNTLMIKEYNLLKALVLDYLGEN